MAYRKDSFEAQHLKDGARRRTGPVESRVLLLHYGTDDQGDEVGDDDNDMEVTSGIDALGGSGGGITWTDEKGAVMEGKEDWGFGGQVMEMRNEELEVDIPGWDVVQGGGGEGGAGRR